MVVGQRLGGGWAGVVVQRLEIFRTGQGVGLRGPWVGLAPPLNYSRATRAKDVDYVDEPAGDEAATVTCTARKVSGVGIGGMQDGAQGCAGPGIAASQEPAGQPASPTKWGGTPHPQGGEPGRKAYKAYRGA